MATQTSPRHKATGDSEERAKSESIDKARQLAPDIPARIGSTPATPYRGRDDIFGRLVDDHDRHRALFAMIGETEANSPERKLLFEELVREIRAHEAAEDQAVWSSVLRNPATTEFARHAIGEHKEMDRMLADLAARDMASPAWMQRLHEAKDEYLHHIREEEQEQFQAAEKHLDQSDIEHMREVFDTRKRVEKKTADIEGKIRIKD